MFPETKSRTLGKTKLSNCFPRELTLSVYCSPTLRGIVVLVFTTESVG